MNPWWSSLVAVVVGGLISAGTSFLLEQVRSRRNRFDKRNDAKRDALRRALAWIDPMERALNAAEIQVYGLLNGSVTDQQFRSAFPDLLSELKEFDLSPDQRLVLDVDPYPQGNHIRQAVERLKYDAIDHWGKTLYPKHSPSMSIVDARYQCSQTVEILRQQVDALRQQLAEEYKRTFD